MTELRLVTLNGGERHKETNAPIAEAFTQLTEDATDSENREPAGVVPLMPCLGVVAMPYPPDKNGKAEGVVAEGVGGLPSVCVAGWDTRSFQACANMQPGDWGAMSTGPANASQILLKEKKRQVVLSAKKKNKKQLLLMLDGENEIFQLLVNGAVIQIDKNGRLDFSDKSGKTGISLHDGTIDLRCSVLNVGGMAPTMAVAMVPPKVGLPMAPGGVIPPAPCINICF